MTTHNLVRRYAREDPQLLGNKSFLRPRQCEASIVPNARRARISFILPLVSYALLLPEGSDLFNRGSGEAVHVVSVSRVAGVMKTTFSITRTVLAPRAEKGLVFLDLHFCVQPLIKFHRHPCKRKTLVKKKRKKKRKNSDEPNEYSLIFSLISMVCKT